MTNTLTIGAQAPNFSLPADDGGTVTLSALQGKNVVVYFYPKADTSGCTIEAKDFTDRAAQFEAANTIVLGISPDEIKTLCKFRDKYSLAVRLLADTEKQAAEAYGVWVEKSMYGKKYMGIERSTILVDASGKIARIWPKVKIPDHAEEVLAAAKALSS